MRTDFNKRAAPSSSADKLTKQSNASLATTGSVSVDNLAIAITISEHR